MNADAEASAPVQGEPDAGLVEKLRDAFLAGWHEGQKPHAAYNLDKARAYVQQKLRSQPSTAKPAPAAPAGPVADAVFARAELAYLKAALEQTGGLAVTVSEAGLRAALEAALPLPREGWQDRYPLGSTYRIEHDGFEGTVIGYYTTLEGKNGVDLQLKDTQVVHVYGTKWLNPTPPTNDK